MSTLHESKQMPRMVLACLQYEGTALSYQYNYSGYEGYNLLDYVSGVIHHTVVPDLKPGTEYYYRVGDDRYNLSPVTSFRTVANKFPIKVGLTAVGKYNMRTPICMHAPLLLSTPRLDWYFIAHQGGVIPPKSRETTSAIHSSCAGHQDNANAYAKGLMSKVNRQHVHRHKSTCNMPTMRPS
jgi:hypothetical protein